MAGGAQQRSPQPDALIAIGVACGCIGRGLATPSGYDNGVLVLLCVILCLAAASYSSRYCFLWRLNNWSEMSRRAAAKRRADELLRREDAARGDLPMDLP